MKLILARHRETKENSEGIIQGHLHGVLSEKGLSQAKALAESLKNEEIDCVYSSDLDRASDTAKIVLKYHPNLEIQLTDSLRERFLGKFQGKKKSDFGLSKEDSIAELADTDIETAKELFERAKKFLYELLKSHRNQTVLCVSHNGISKAMIAVITNKNPEKILEVENIPNAGYKVFELDNLN